MILFIRFIVFWSWATCSIVQGLLLARGSGLRLVDLLVVFGTVRCGGWNWSLSQESAFISVSFLWPRNF